jgi:hypothetical protein
MNLFSQQDMLCKMLDHNFMIGNCQVLNEAVEWQPFAPSSLNKYQYI